MRNSSLTAPLLGTMLLGVLLGVLLAGGCAVIGPTLVENQYLDTVGEEAALNDIEACIAEARAMQPAPAAPVSGPGMGDIVERGAESAATKAATSAVTGSDPLPGVITSLVSTGVDGLMSLLFEPQPNQAPLDPAMKTHVENCLCSKGYEVDGWE